MDELEKAKNSLLDAWPAIKSECLSVLGSELHYQAMIYHCLRNEGKVPVNQLGMNVKMWIKDPITDLFCALADKKNEGFKRGFEPIPDIVIFSEKINSDWRRRNREKTLLNMLIAIEVKASERKNGRLRPKEIIFDLDKLHAHRAEAEYRNSSMLPIMLIIDSARQDEERMTIVGLNKVKEYAKQLDIELMYCSQEHDFNSLIGT